MSSSPYIYIGAVMRGDGLSDIWEDIAHLLSDEGGPLTYVGDYLRAADPAVYTPVMNDCSEKSVVSFAEMTPESMRECVKEFEEEFEDAIQEIAEHCPSVEVCFAAITYWY